MWELVQTIPFPTQPVLAYSNGKFITVSDVWQRQYSPATYKGIVYYSTDLTSTDWTSGSAELLGRSAFVSYGDDNGFVIGCLEGVYQYQPIGNKN